MAKCLLIIAILVGMVGSGFVPTPITPVFSAQGVDPCRVKYSVLKNGVPEGTSPKTIAAMFKVAGVWPCLPLEIRQNVSNWRWQRPDHSIRLSPGPGLEELIRTERGRTIQSWELAVFMGRDRFGRDWWVRRDCTNAGFEPQMKATKARPAAKKPSVTVNINGDCNNVSVNGRNVRQITNCPAPEAAPVTEVPPPPPFEVAPTIGGHQIRVEVRGKDPFAFHVVPQPVLTTVGAGSVASQTSPTGVRPLPGSFAGTTEVWVDYRNARMVTRDGQQIPVQTVGRAVAGAGLYRAGLPSNGCPTGTWQFIGEVSPSRDDGTRVWFTVPVVTDTRLIVELRSVPGWVPAFPASFCRRPSGS